MRLCDLCLSSGSTIDVRLLEDDGENANSRIVTGDLCSECVSALDDMGLAEGIAYRFAERPRSRKRRERDSAKVRVDKPPGATVER